MSVIESTELYTKTYWLDKDHPSFMGEMVLT